MDLVDKEHRSPLLLAAAHRGWRSVDVLLSKGADPAIRDSKNKNLLHVVVMAGGSLSDLLSLNHAKESWVCVGVCGTFWYEVGDAQTSDVISLNHAKESWVNVGV